MTRPRLSRAARAALYAQAQAEAAERQMTALERRIAEAGAVARLALTVRQSRSPDRHPALEELVTRVQALARDWRGPVN